MMMIKRLTTGYLGTNTYMVINDDTKEAVIIDPADIPANLRAHIAKEGLEIKAILLTHAHFDHITGLDKAIEIYGQMPVYVGKQDLELLHNEVLNESLTFGKEYTYDGGDAIYDGQVLSVIGCDFKIIHTPGHTPGGVCYYLESEEVLFSGDTLFRASVGRTDFRASNHSDLVHSIREKLFALPEDTMVYPGHMGATTIGFEKKHNPFV